MMMKVKASIQVKANSQVKTNIQIIGQQLKKRRMENKQWTDLWMIRIEIAL